MKKYLTEFLGTFVLVFTILNFSNPMIIGVNLAIIIYIGYHFSGAHYNPAVTFCIYLMKKISLKESFFYKNNNMISKSKETVNFCCNVAS